MPEGNNDLCPCGKTGTDCSSTELADCPIRENEARIFDNYYRLRLDRLLNQKPPENPPKQ
jgi:hypothetical protein